MRNIPTVSGPDHGEHDPDIIRRAYSCCYDRFDDREKARLVTQAKVLKDFEQPVYDSLLNGRSDMAILDIGSNTGDLVNDRIISRKVHRKVIGLEWNEGAVGTANRRFGSDSVRFCRCNIEDPDFENNLEIIMAENGIDSFDFVNISMVILHLKDPCALLKVVRRHMSEDGLLFIKDIDDGINYAYPDRNGDFERVFRICRESEISGFRHSGRQIYPFLKSCGFKDIQLVKSGLSTMNMDHSEIQALFDTYFSFILDDTRAMKERYPGSERVDADLKWYTEMYPELEQRFHDEYFVFSLGFMIFVARP